MSQKYGLDEIKVMLKLVHARVSKDHIKLVLRLAEGGMTRDDVDNLYDILATEVKPLNDHTPPSSLPRSDITVADFESPPSSQGYSSTISDNETSSRPLEIDSLHIDDDPWAGLPKDPNYTPRTSNSKQSHNVTHDSSVSVTSYNQHQNITTASEKRTRDRFVFRTIHQEILNNAFFQNPYPENDEKEILVDKCNHALEGYKCRPLRENEKMTILNITNWFNNRRKEKKRKCYQETPTFAGGLPVAVMPPSSHHSQANSSIVKEEIMSEQEDDL